VATTAVAGTTSVADTTASAGIGRSYNWQPNDGLLPKWERPSARSPRALPPQIWLPFLDTYRTMCLAPQPEFRRLLEQVRDLPIAA
jgi:hypothetical protein